MLNLKIEMALKVNVENINKKEIGDDKIVKVSGGKKSPDKK